MGIVLPVPLAICFHALVGLANLPGRCASLATVHRARKQHGCLFGLNCVVPRGHDEGVGLGEVIDARQAARVRSLLGACPSER